MQTPGDSIRGGFRGVSTLQFPSVWSELMESVSAAVEAGESRREVMEWARSEYDDHCRYVNSAAASEAGAFDAPVFDVQGRL